MKTKWPIIILFIFTLIAVVFYITTYTSQDKQETFPLPKSHPSIQKAIEFLKSQTDEQGRIGSLSITDWAAIAIASADTNLSDWMQTKQYLINTTVTLNDSSATDWQRHCLALIAFGVNPENVSGVNMVRHIMDYYQNGQIGNESNLYDDIFGILALRSSGMKQTHEIIENSTLHLLNKQKADGSWGDVDTTAAAIMALRATNQNTSSYQIQQALDYIKDQQQNNGGFQSWGTTNTASTTWAVCSISSVQEHPYSSKWKKNNQSPVDYLLCMQQADGSFLYTKDTSVNNVWMTCYAIISLTGETFITGSYTMR